MKIAILYICTGKYAMFWKGFYESAEKNFLNGHEREYFVFTDQKLPIINDRINVVYQENLGWPYNTLMRFDMFKKVIDQLKKFDFIYFFNANVIFNENIGEEFLPEKENLLAVIHPSFYQKDRVNYTYETNQASTAYIPENEGEYYFMGGVNGGKAAYYIKLIVDIAKQIDDDLKNNIIAVWHDESQLNKYLLDKEVKIFPPAYGYPEGWSIPYEQKILILDKNNFGGHHFLRNSRKQRIITLLKNWYHKIFKKFQNT